MNGYGRNTAVIEGPGTIGYVTIDWEMRGFRAGVAWLQEVEERFQRRSQRRKQSK